MKKKIVFTAMALWSVSVSYALDLYTLVDSKCQIHQGVVINAGLNRLELLTLKGDKKVLEVDRITTILTYNTYKGPFKSFVINDSLKKKLKVIYTNENKVTPLFTGWAYRFVEDLIFFWSITGKSYVLDQGQIYKITTLEDVESSAHSQKKKRLKYKNGQKHHYDLAVEDFVQGCQYKDRAKKAKIMPVKIISDKIKISEFFEQLKKGYQNLDNLHERTHLYARPYLYSKRNKLGLIYFKSSLENNPLFPVSYQWSTGEQYHFQSENAIGGQISRNLPNLDPMPLLRTDFKSHFFQGTFEGNLFGISAGSSSLEEREDFPEDKKIDVSNDFNYLALMGGDIGAWSLSAGAYFPITHIYFKDLETREILASKSSPILRLMYTTNKFHMRGIFSWSKYQYDRDKIQQQVRMRRLNSSSNSTSLLDFRFKNAFLKMGGEYYMSDMVTLSLYSTLYWGKYFEKIETYDNFLNYKNLGMSFGIKHHFSYYVSFQCYLNFLKRSYEGKFEGKNIARNDLKKSIGGVFELLF